MEDEALTLVVEFAGLTVLAKLDNWIGEVIMGNKVDVGEPGEEEEDKQIYHLKRLNYKLTLF